MPEMLFMFKQFLQVYHQRVRRASKSMWNFTVMGVMVIDSSDFKVSDKAYAEESQRKLETLTPNDLDIFSKYTVMHHLSVANAIGGFISVMNLSTSMSPAVHFQS
jgi:hypothetical protein